MEEQDTDQDSDEDLRETGHDQQIEDLIRKQKHAQATAPSTYDMWQGITQLSKPPNDQNAGAPPDVKAQWTHMPYNDIDCDDTWALLTALSLKIRSNEYDPMDLKEWPTGTLMRLQAVIQWAKEIHKQFTKQHYWMGINGAGGARDMHAAILTTMRSRASLRQANAVLREI